jgi:hypothetical protein
MFKLYRNLRACSLLEMAEGVGFEPTVALRLLLISSQVPLTTQPPFRALVSSVYQHFIVTGKMIYQQFERRALIEIENAFGNQGSTINRKNFCELVPIGTVKDARFCVFVTVAAALQEPCIKFVRDWS